MGTFFCITGNGDRPLQALIQGATKVISVDCDAHQNEILKLKMSFLGHPLSFASKNYWSKHCSKGIALPNFPGLDRIKDRLDRIEIHTRSGIHYLRTMEEEQISCFMLGNLLSYLCEDEQKELNSHIYRLQV